jgi:hypothetical protein
LNTIDALDIPGLVFWNFHAVTPAMWDTVRQWLRQAPAATSAADQEHPKEAR